jgi:hypothetical protein
VLQECASATDTEDSISLAWFQQTLYRDPEDYVLAAGGNRAGRKRGKQPLWLATMMCYYILPVVKRLGINKRGGGGVVEGSEIARQIVRALVGREVKVLYVTHMFDLAEGFYRLKMGDALFLRAERLGDGRRTFRLSVAEPLPTSYGEDLYRQIFGPTPDGVNQSAIL